MKGRISVATRELQGMKRGPAACTSSFYGIGLVARQQVRKARRGRVAAAILFMLVGLAALAVALRYLVFGEFDFNGAPAVILTQSLTPWAMGAALLMTGVGALCGATAAPALASEEEVQSSLLAGLSASVICAGRLLAGLRIPLAVLLYSGLMWSLVQAAARIFPAAAGGFGAVVLAHLILVCALFMTGSVAFAFQTGARGRSWGSGLAAGLFVAVALIGAPLLVNSRLQAMDDPSGILQILLLLNPVFAVESALGRNILRAPWIYAHTTAADYLLDYPSPLATAGVFLIIGLAAFAIAVWRLRAATRR